MNKNISNLLPAIILLVGVAVAGYFLVYNKSSYSELQLPTLPRNETLKDLSIPEGYNYDFNLVTKVYTNEEYGFSFQYPPDVVSVNLIDHIIPGGTDLLLPCDGSKTSSSDMLSEDYCQMRSEKDGSAGYTFSFAIFPKPMVNLEAYVNNFKSKNNVSYYPVTIDGKKGYEFYYSHNAVNTMYVQDSKHLFWFRYSAQDASIARIILATFKFTESGTSKPTSVNCPGAIPGEGIPSITSLSSKTVSIGDTITVHGCNLIGFEGDKNVWIENKYGVRGILYGIRDQDSENLKFKLESPVCTYDISYKGGPCESFLELIPGTYKIYVRPWNEYSNEKYLEIK